MKFEFATVYKNDAIDWADYLNNFGYVFTCETYSNYKKKGQRLYEFRIEVADLIDQENVRVALNEIRHKNKRIATEIMRRKNKES